MFLWYMVICCILWSWRQVVGVVFWEIWKWLGSYLAVCNLCPSFIFVTCKQVMQDTVSKTCQSCFTRVANDSADNTKKHFHRIIFKLLVASERTKRPQSLPKRNLVKLLISSDIKNLCSVEDSTLTLKKGVSHQDRISEAVQLGKMLLLDLLMALIFFKKTLKN